MPTAKQPASFRTAITTRIYSHGDDFEVTPLQLAVMVSALSNGGKKVVPQYVRPCVERTAFRPQVRETVSLPMRSVEGVLPGMIGAEYRNRPPRSRLLDGCCGVRLDRVSVRDRGSGCSRRSLRSRIEILRSGDHPRPERTVSTPPRSPVRSIRRLAGRSKGTATCSMHANSR